MPLHTLRTAHVQTTFVCSGKCIHCPYPYCMHSQYHGTMSDAVFQTVLDRLARLTLDTVCPCLENEPFADAAIFERAEALFGACRARRLELTTNAVLLDAVKRKRLAELLEGKAHEIRVIFHGTRKEQYAGVMGIPFGESLENVIGLLRLTEEADLRVSIHCAGKGVAGSLFQDYHCPEHDFIRFWEEIFQKHCIRKRPELRYRPILDRAGSSLHRGGACLPVPVRDDLTGLHCPRISEHLHVLHTGELVLCCMDYEGETVFGDITKDDLPQIFASKNRRLLADSARGLRASPPDFLCKRCLYPGG